MACSTGDALDACAAQHRLRSPPLRCASSAAFLRRSAPSADAAESRAQLSCIILPSTIGEIAMTERHVGFIGVGRMGNHMAGRLVEAGYRVTVYDTNETAMARLVQRGAERAESAAAVASAAETVLVSLPTPDIVRAVALGPAGVAAGTKVKTFVDLSTTGPRVAAAVAEGLAAKGIVAVDAPVSGGPSGAEKGTLAVMVACPRPLAEQLRPIIGVIGKYFYIGEKPGMGQTMKVINNLMSAAAQAITAEAMVMGAKAGLDAQTMVDVINSGSGRNTA